MQLFRASTVPQLIRDVAVALRHAPEEPSRDGMTRELAGPVMCSVSRPWHRYPLNPGREGNPWVTLAEWPWLIAGRNDVAWLEHYLPRAKDFSDDGRTWRAGYGPRLRKWGDHASAPYAVDQLHEAIERLKRSTGTRQAVMSLWDPASDNEPGSKDYPCTNWFQALIRGGMLHLHVVMRSNDLIWGFSGVNLYNWTMLQELMAACTDTDIGVYTHTAGSLHVYERHFKRLGAMAAAQQLPALPAPQLIEPTTLDDYTLDCVTALAAVEACRGKPLSWHELAMLVRGSGQLQEWAEFMLLHEWLGERLAPWKSLARGVRRPDWLLALLEYLCRTGRMSGTAALEVLSERQWANALAARYVQSGLAMKINLTEMPGWRVEHRAAED